MNNSILLSILKYYKHKLVLNNKKTNNTHNKNKIINCSRKKILLEKQLRNYLKQLFKTNIFTSYKEIFNDLKYLDYLNNV